MLGKPRGSARVGGWGGSTRVEGWRGGEAGRGGDGVLSGDGEEREGPVGPRVVEELFVRTSPVLRLHVGGRVITTTAEHPFWVEGKGWTPAGELCEGDVLVGH